MIAACVRRFLPSNCRNRPKRHKRSTVGPPRLLPVPSAHPMIVRRTQTRSTATANTTSPIAWSVRACRRVRQRTLLNLGRHFAIPQSSWPLLCSRLDQLRSQHALPLAAAPRQIEHTAEHLAAQLLVRQVALPGAAKPHDNAADGAFHNLNVDSLQLRARSVGVEQVALWAIEQVQLLPLLKRYSGSTVGSAPPQ